MAFNISVALANRGCKTILCGFDRYVTDSMYRKQSFDVMPISSRGWRQFKDITMLRLLWQIRRCYGDRPVVLYALTWKLARMARFLANRWGWRLVVFAHGLEVTKHAVGEARPSMVKVFEAADLCLGVSHYTSEVLCKIGIDQSKVHVLNNSVDTDIYTPATNDHEKRAIQKLREQILGGEGIVILTLARVIERKGQDSVIEALAHLKRRNPSIEPVVRYVVAGEGDQREIERLKSLARRLGVSEQVIFWGYVPQKDMKLLYHACDIYVMNSRIIDSNRDVEGFGITIIEASACGKPVIGGRSGGVTDAVNDGESGFLVEPEDIDMLASKLEALIADAELRHRMGESGLQWVHSRFTIEAAGERLLKLVKELP